VCVCVCVCVCMYVCMYVYSPKNTMSWRSENSVSYVSQLVFS